MDLILDFALYMYTSITTNNIKTQDIPKYKKRIKKGLLYLFVVMIAIIFFTLERKG